MRVFVQHQGIKDVLWPAEVPENGFWGEALVHGGHWHQEPDTPTPSARCIMLAFSNGGQWNEFRNLGWSGGEFKCQPPKILRGIMHSFGQGDAMSW